MVVGDLKDALAEQVGDDVCGAKNSAICETCFVNPLGVYRLGGAMIVAWQPAVA